MDHGSENGQFWRYSALRRHDYWTDASAKWLDHCQLRVKEGVAISDLGDSGALAGLGFEVRISRSGPCLRLYRCIFKVIRHIYTLCRTESSTAQDTITVINCPAIQAAAGLHVMYRESSSILPRRGQARRIEASLRCLCRGLRCLRRGNLSEPEE